MKNTTIAGIAGVVAGIAIALIVVWGYFTIIASSGSDPISSSIPHKAKPSKNSTEKSLIDERASQTPKDTERIQSRRSGGEFLLEGRGSDKNWGISKSAKFRYHVLMKSTSEVLSLETNESGEIKVVEQRTFDEFQDSILVSDIDIGIDLSTLPMNTIQPAITAIATLIGVVYGDDGTVSAPIGTAINTGLKKLDGVSLRKMCNALGINELPAQTEEALKKIGTEHFANLLMATRNIKGKTYKITYYQKAGGQPMYVQFSYADGSEITDEEERMVLQRVNAFIDCAVLPDGEIRPGKKWNIDASQLEELFDPFAEGRYLGSIGAQRKENDADGNWKIVFDTSKVEIKGKDGKTGNFVLERGSATLDGETRMVNDIFAAGYGKMSKISPHHLLFSAHIEGDCKFQGRLVSEPIKK